MADVPRLIEIYNGGPNPDVWFVYAKIPAGTFKEIAIQVRPQSGYKITYDMSIYPEFTGDVKELIDGIKDTKNSPKHIHG